MGSRLMHYCISKIVNDKLNVNANRFLVGGIAPDVHRLYGETDKTRSHFLVRDEEGIVSVDFESFKKKYRKRFNDSFHLGYYTHLISDDIWLKNIYYKYFKGLPREQRNIVLQKNYRDFHRLNKILVERYSLECNIVGINDAQIDEIDTYYLNEMINCLQSDFIFDQDVHNDSLEILKLEEVIAFIDESVEKSLIEIGRSAWKY